MNDTYTHNIIITNKNNLFCFVGSQTKTDVLLLLINSISLLDLSNYNQKWPLHAVKIEPQNRMLYKLLLVKHYPSNHSVGPHRNYTPGTS